MGYLLILPGQITLFGQVTLLGQITLLGQKLGIDRPKAEEVQRLASCNRAAVLKRRTLTDEYPRTR